MQARPFVLDMDDYKWRTGSPSYSNRLSSVRKAFRTYGDIGSSPIMSYIKKAPDWGLFLYLNPAKSFRRSSSDWEAPVDSSDLSCSP